MITTTTGKKILRKGVQDRNEKKSNCFGEVCSFHGHQLEWVQLFFVCLFVVVFFFVVNFLVY